MTYQDDGITRRELMKLAAVGAAGLAVPPAIAADPHATSTGAKRVRNVIFLVADGMSCGVPTLAEPFSQIVRRRGTVWFDLLRDPNITQSYLQTDSADSLVTDSSAASSAWGSGFRVNNGAVNVSPQGRALTPLTQTVRASGRRVGLVTTTRITHATPAGFAAVQASRNDEHLIAPQYLDQVDVLMGGGRKFFDPTLNKVSDDLISRYGDRGYTFRDHRRHLVSGAAPRRILGIFADDHLPYTLDRMNDEQLKHRVPTLAEMTAAAITSLDQSDAGFFLMVEGGRVDHAAHGNDAAAILWDQIAFDDAIGVALDWTTKRDDTLLVITSDHGNANPGLNGMGGGYTDTNACFAQLAAATMSFDRIAERFRELAAAAQPTRDTVSTLIRQATGITLTDTETDAVWTAWREPQRSTELHTQHRNAAGILGQALGNHNGIGWTGVSHTADWVMLTAVGAGHDAWRGMRHHTDACHTMMRQMGIPDAARGV